MSSWKDEGYTVADPLHIWSLYRYGGVPSQPAWIDVGYK